MYDATLLVNNLGGLGPKDGADSARRNEPIIVLGNVGKTADGKTINLEVRNETRCGQRATELGTCGSFVMPVESSLVAPNRQQSTARAERQ